MEKTTGFVLKSIKYGDTSAIVDVYTSDFGMKSFLVKGFFSPKKKHLKVLQFPFVQVELAFKPTKNSVLINLYQVQAVSVHTQMHQHPIKLMMLQFLSEVLHITLKDDEPNNKTYQYIESQMVVFDSKRDGFADFHLIFLLNLTAFLGFFPNSENDSLPYFDLQEGKFSLQKNAVFCLNEQDTHLWRKLIYAKFDLEYENQFNKSSRQKLLHYILDYYGLHIPGFREPKSLEIIKEVLG